MKDKKIGERK